MRLDGLTTSQVYSSLVTDYNAQRSTVANTCDTIEQERGKIDTRYALLDSKRVTPPPQQKLNDEYNKYFDTYSKLELQREKAFKLEGDLVDGMKHLNRPPLNADTMETIKRTNPELHALVEQNYKVCRTSFNDLSEKWGDISILQQRMSERLITLGNSLKYFKGIIDNGGKPLSYTQRAILAAYAPPKPNRPTEETANQTSPSDPTETAKTVANNPKTVESDNTVPDLIVIENTVSDLIVESTIGEPCVMVASVTEEPTENRTEEPGTTPEIKEATVVASPADPITSSDEVKKTKLNNPQQVSETAREVDALSI